MAFLLANTCSLLFGTLGLKDYLKSNSRIQLDCCEIVIHMLRISQRLPNKYALHCFISLFIFDGGFQGLCPFLSNFLISVSVTFE